MTPVAILLIVLGGLLALVVGATALLYIIVPVFKGIGFVIRQIFNFIIGEIGDVFRLIGAVITGLLFVPMTVGSVIIGRWSAAAHFGRAIKSECSNFLLCIYRLGIGHPARLFCLHGITEGLERRLPQVVAAAPGPDSPNRKTGKFPGYEIVGSLPGGGSGSKLYVAEPDETKLAILARSGYRDVRQVVIKAFSIHDGSSLPQIVRESRSLDAAKKLGLVLDHELTNERFFYVMKYVPGQPLALVTQHLHTASPDTGLADMQLRTALGYSADLIRTLQTYHAGGLWHKDVKPDNIIVDGREAHLVDFGLVTPLRSAMTLTTHGTEYFRDPEMVRLALRGVKVHEVDGAKFDLYAAGAVLYSMIENSFPAHGVLSPINKRCPEALRWIIRRAMTDYDKRYTSAGQLLADLEVVRLSRDPFTVKPIDLPSMRTAGVADAADETEAAYHAAARDVGHFAPAGPAAAAAAAAAAVAMGGTPAQAAQAASIGAAAAAGSFGGPIPAPQSPLKSGKPKIRVLNWWTGGHAVQADGPESRRSPVPPQYAPHVAPDPFVPVVMELQTPAGARPRRPAAEQLERARTRAAEARRRAHERRSSRTTSLRGRRAKPEFNNKPNAGVILASLLTLGLVIVGVGTFITQTRQGTPARSAKFLPTIQVDRNGVTTFHLSSIGDLGAIGHDQPPTPPATPNPDGFRVEDHRGLPAINKTPTPDAHAALDEASGTALLVSDFRAPMPEQVESLINAATESFNEAGFRVTGDILAAQPPDSPDDLELIAGLRMALGQTPADADDASDKLLAWLKGQKGKVDYILWFGLTSDAQNPQPIVRLIGPADDSKFNRDDVESLRDDLTKALSQ